MYIYTFFFCSHCMNTYYAIQDATDTTEHLESTATTEVEWWQAAPKEGKP